MSDPRSALAAILDYLVADATIGAAVGDQAALDEAGESWTMPYLTGLVVSGYDAGIDGDGAAVAWNDLVQIDLWESRFDESTDLFRAVIARLEGARVDGAGLKLRVLSAGPIPEGGEDGDPDVLHNAVTVGYSRLR